MQCRMRDKKEVVNGKILKIVRIMAAHMNPIVGRVKVLLEKLLTETSKLLDNLVQSNKTVSRKTKVTEGMGEQYNDSL